MFRHNCGRLRGGLIQKDILQRLQKQILKYKILSFKTYGLKYMLKCKMQVTLLVLLSWRYGIFCCDR